MPKTKNYKSVSKEKYKGGSRNNVYTRDHSKHMNFRMAKNFNYKAHY
jgi:hypothetical protein